MSSEGARSASPHGSTGRTGGWPGGWRRWYSPERPVRLGVSACLLGDAVRWDGGHKRDTFLTETLAPWVQWVRVCPEIEAGMGVPRPPIRVEEVGGRLRLVEPATGRDHTDRMRRWAEARVEELARAVLDGYVLKSGSPSCGLGSVKVHRDGRSLHARGDGLFAAELRKRWPGLSVVEERALTGRRAREDFAERAFAWNRWRTLAERGVDREERDWEQPDRAGLAAYHEAHKFLFLARNEPEMRHLGRLASSPSGSGEHAAGRELRARYEAGLATVLSKPACRGGHVNVLLHARGWLKRDLEPDEARRLDAAIEEYRLANAPRSRSLDLIRRLAFRHRCRCLLGQVYFDPFPAEFGGELLRSLDNCSQGSDHSREE